MSNSFFQAQYASLYWRQVFDSFLSDIDTEGQWGIKKTHTHTHTHTQITGPIFLQACQCGKMDLGREYKESHSYFISLLYYRGRCQYIGYKMNTGFDWGLHELISFNSFLPAARKVASHFCCFGYMQVPCLNFTKKYTPLWDNCKDGAHLFFITTGKTGTGWYIVLLFTGKSLSHSHWHSQKRVKLSMIVVTSVFNCSVPVEIIEKEKDYIACLMWWIWIKWSFALLVVCVL